MLTLCHQQPPFHGSRHRNRRGSYNGYRKPHPTNRGGTQASVSRAGSGQNPRVQATASTSGGRVSNSTGPDADPEPPRVEAAVTGASPPRGVLLDFNHDVEFVQLPPNMVADMETAQTVSFRLKGKQRLPEWPVAIGSDEPVSGVSVRVDGDDMSLHQTIATTGHAASARLEIPIGSYPSPPAVEEGVVPVPSQPQLPGSPASGSLEVGSPHESQTYQRVHEIAESQKGDSTNCEELPALTITGGSTEGMLIDLDDDLAVVLPVGADADTDSTAHPEEKDVLAAGLDSGAGHNLQLEDLEDDQIIFQGDAAKGIRRDFKALFVSSDDDSQTAPRAIDLKAIFEKYSEVIICR